MDVSWHFGAQIELNSNRAWLGHYELAVVIVVHACTVWEMWRRCVYGLAVRNSVFFLRTKWIKKRDKHTNENERKLKRLHTRGTQTKSAAAAKVYSTLIYLDARAHSTTHTHKRNRKNDRHSFFLTLFVALNIAFWFALFFFFFSLLLFLF